MAAALAQRQRSPLRIISRWRRLRQERWIAYWRSMACPTTTTLHSTGLLPPDAAPSSALPPTSASWLAVGSMPGWPGVVSPERVVYVIDQSELAGLLGASADRGFATSLAYAAQRWCFADVCVQRCICARPVYSTAAAQVQPPRCSLPRHRAPDWQRIAARLLDIRTARTERCSCSICPRSAIARPGRTR